MPQVRLAAIAATTAIALALTPGVAAAQNPGSFDTTFGTNGVTTAGSAQLLAVAVQPDGEVIAAGQSGGNVFVERLSASGQPVGTPFTGPAGAARAVALEGNGDVVVAGSGPSGMLVGRLTSSLTADSSFGSGGFANPTGGVANAVAVTPGGDVLAAGETGGVGNEAVVAELTPQGTADTSFGSHGVADLSLGGNSQINALAIQPDGRVLLAGRDVPPNPGTVTNAVLARINPTGGLDGSFSGGFVSYYNSAGAYASFNGVAIQTNGKIVVGGVDAGPDAIFVRYNADGTPDSSFGAKGAAAIPAAKDLSVNPGAPVGAYGIGIAGGGVLVDGGSFEIGGGEIAAALWAVTPQGTNESGFGSTGDTELGPTPAQAVNYEACGLAIAPDGSIVTVGDNPPAPDQEPCMPGKSTSGFVARYVGYGTPPPPPVAGAAPSATTGATNSLTAASALVTGTVNPNGLATNYHFDYGTSTAYGASSASQSAGSASGEVPVSAALSGLQPGTTYHYRLVATNADGNATGTDETFTTPSTGRGTTAPAATLNRATKVGEDRATVSAVVNAGGGATYRFEYGRSTHLGSSTRLTAVAGATDTTVSAQLTRLRPHTTYHYRITVTNTAGTVTTRERTFTTARLLRSTLTVASTRLTTSRASTKGVSMVVTCSAGCSVTGSLLLGRADARALGLGSRTVSVGRASAALKQKGSVRLIIHVSSSDARALGHRRSVALTLRVVASPSAGGPAVVHDVTITLTR